MKSVEPAKTQIWQINVGENEPIQSGDTEQETATAKNTFIFYGLMHIKTKW